MKSWLLTLTSLLALAAVGCGKKNNNGVAFPFERAEHIGFTCFGPLASNEQEYVTLPEHCCKLLDPSSNDGGVANVGDDGGGTDDAGATVIVASPECRYAGAELVGTPTLMHALVTQSTRGEVAAVDLVNDKVLDSDRLVPGFTFLDTGGLPSAIVSPKTQPRIIQPAGRSSDPLTAGPVWTYVASAEEFQVRAIATCRFRSGAACGPDSLPENADAAYTQRTRFPLPAAPRDMLLGPGPTGADQALWVTLPDLGLIARLELAETPTVPIAAPLEGGPDHEVRSVDAFALSSDGQRKLLDPVFFRVPMPTSVALGMPVAEPSEYVTTCGLGRPFAPAKFGVPLPLAPRGELATTVQPNLMHFDEKSGLLLVTDRVQPVLHAFTFAKDGTLNALAALPTGAIVRDFVITPAVPSTNLAPDLAAPMIAPEDRSSEKQRYLYAIDDRGFLMLFDFQQDATGAVKLQPLLAPTPGTTYADRIDLPTPVTAIDVIDTRTQSDWQCGERPAGEDDNLAGLTTLAYLNAQRRAADELPRGTARNAAIAKWEARLNIYGNADSRYLRGVFLAAASANGTLSILDIHDLDVSCRARKFCCKTEQCTGMGDSDTARDSSQLESVAIRRHAVRRASVGVLQSVIPNPVLIGAHEPGKAPCQVDAEPYTPLLNDVRICAPSDPWTAPSNNWSAIFQGSIPNSETKGAAFQELPGAVTTDKYRSIRVSAPRDMNFCSLGAQPNDLIAVLGNPPDRLEANCGKPSADSASVFVITEAFSDHLIVQEPQRVVGDATGLEPDSTVTPTSTLRTVDEIMGCYPDYVGIELRAGGFLVSGTSGAYLHRITTGVDKHCIPDPTKDPLLTSRPVPLTDGHPGDLLFKNPYVEFVLAGPALADQSLRNTSVQVQNGSSGLQFTSVPTGNTTTDALPAL
ncbi:MAG: hypothetical protein JWN04_242, partial [Myxococcaceae bacterium]|nr:hypothetical protein [Myxococcaceae bacterium]